ncbi:MAG: iron chelate uptake ABC transporter family permease subunit [Kiritimatiellia bacterium]
MKKSALNMMKTAKFSLFIVLFLICGSFLPWIGAEKLHVREVLAFLGGSWSPDGMIFFHIRLPRVFLGLLAGGALAAAGALIVPALWILGRQARALNPLGLGEEMAAGQGVEVAHVRRWTLIGAGLAAAGVATVAGPIGFIGLLAPHAARRLIGPDMRRVLPASFLLGGALLAASDACGRWVAAPLELPVGALTALIGGPSFLWLLAKM